MKIQGQKNLTVKIKISLFNSRLEMSEELVNLKIKVFKYKERREKNV